MGPLNQCPAGHLIVALSRGPSVERVMYLRLTSAGRYVQPENGRSASDPTERPSRQARGRDPPSVSTGLYGLPRWTNRTELQQHCEVVADRPVFGDAPGLVAGDAA